MDFVIKYCYERINPQWDAFIHEVNGELLQTSAWANYELKYFGWRAVRFYFKNEGTIVAGCQITVISDDLWGNIGLVRSGPCFKIMTHELMRLVVIEMKKSVQILNLTYLMVTPDYNEHDLVPFLESEKFESKFPNLPPYRITSTKEATLVLDLNLSTDELLHQMKSMRQRGIKKGLKSPFQVRLGGRDDLKVYYDLYHFTATRHKYTDPITNKTVSFYPTKESHDEICKIWDELSPHGWVKLFLGTVEEEIICGALVFTFGKTFRYANWGWNLKYADYHISDAIQWEMIQWAKNNNFLYYDFCQIDRRIADAYLSKEPVNETLKKHFIYGPTIYKLNFGGNMIKYPCSFVCYSDKMKHLIETSSDELTHLFKLSKDYYWAKKNFFRDHQDFFISTKLNNF